MRSPGVSPRDSADLVTVERSGVREAWHRGSVAIVDTTGRLTQRAGDPNIVTFARSAMKPLSGAVCHLLAGEDLSPEELAVTCASHNGEDVHVRAVGQVLARAGLDFSALACPPDMPYDPETAIAVTTPRAELHNCSGKHAGMLLASVRRGYDLKSYPKPSHPLQLQILENLTAVVGSAPVAVGIDGCGVPVHAYPLVALARLFAKLARPDGLGDLTQAITSSTQAMRSAPYLVAGRKRICTALMQSVPGSIVKIGGEGLICIGLTEQRLGIAIKIDDGSMRALAPAAIRVLQLLSILKDVPIGLREHASPPLMGGGVQVGKLVASLESLSDP